MSKRLTVPDVIDACENGKFEDLVGAVETTDFEFKVSPYRLDEEHQKRELAKDVSGLANADGGVILLGAKAVQMPAAIPTYGEEIGEIRPFPEDLLDEKQYRDVLSSPVPPYANRPSVAKPLVAAPAEWRPNHRHKVLHAKADGGFVTAFGLKKP